jgi:cleavage stimulation factor subunit 3
VVYFYKQALMALAFFPEMWFDAAEFCFLKTLAARLAESCSESEVTSSRSARLNVSKQLSGFASSAKRAAKVREPYDKLLDALYELINKARNQETQDRAFERQ